MTPDPSDRYEMFPVSIDDATEELRAIVREIQADPTGAAAFAGLSMSQIVKRLTRLKAAIVKLDRASKLMRELKGMPDDV